MSLEGNRYGLEASSADCSNSFSDLYSQTSSKDTIRTKILVYVVYISQTIQIILFSKDGFAQFVVDTDIRKITAGLQTKSLSGWFSLCVIQGLGV